jgi:hypothetical protein
MRPAAAPLLGPVILGEELPDRVVLMPAGVVLMPVRKALM